MLYNKNVVFSNNWSKQLSRLLEKLTKIKYHSIRLDKFSKIQFNNLNANLFLLVLPNALKRYTYMLSNFGGLDDFFKKLKFISRGAKLTFIVLKFIQW